MAPILLQSPAHYTSGEGEPGLDGAVGAWQSLRQQIESCTACPRLVAYRTAVARQRKREFAAWTYWGRPVAGFGDLRARLLIVGLAPAAHGANRTGRMFTGDASARFLVSALYRADFANQPFSERADDGLQLRDAFMTAPVRCAPPANRPLAEEARRCFPFLQAEFALLGRVRVLLALGRFAFDACRKLLAPALDEAQRVALGRARFVHGAVLRPGDGVPAVVACYHPSRQNTQTGRLTPSMLDEVLAKVRELLERP